MTFPEAIESSPYHAAAIEHQGYTTIVEEGEEKDVFSLTTQQGALPPFETLLDVSLPGAQELLQERRLDTDAWYPLGEHGEPL
jgi:hypothetical protein